MITTMRLFSLNSSASHNYHCVCVMRTFKICSPSHYPQMGPLQAENLTVTETCFLLQWENDFQLWSPLLSHRATGQQLSLEPAWLRTRDPAL